MLHPRTSLGRRVYYCDEPGVSIASNCKDPKVEQALQGSSRAVAEEVGVVTIYFTICLDRWCTL